MSSVELTGVSTHEPPVIDDDSLPLETEKIVVETEYGPLHVTIQGNRDLPTIITYHDIGQNHQSCFQNFFSYPPTRALAEVMCIAHIDAPGMERDADTLPADYVYPFIDQLADQIPKVMEQLDSRRIVGFGVGFGGNVLLRFAEKYPQKVYGLILCGVNAFQSSWAEWGWFKAAIHSLWSTKTVTKYTEDCIIKNHFSANTIETKLDMIESVKDYLHKHINPVNLSKLMQVYVSRPNYGKEITKDFKPNVLLCSGQQGLYLDEVETLHSQFNPVNTSYLRIFNTGNHLHEENPHKILEAMILFLQGLGLAIHATLRLNDLSRKHANPEDLGLKPVAKYEPHDKVTKI